MKQINTGRRTGRTAMRALQILFFAAGFISMAYFAVMISYAGLRTAFAPFWLAAGICGISVSLVLRGLILKGTAVPAPVLTGIWAVILVTVFVFAGVEGMILHAAAQGAEPGADYVIVLGAQVRGTRITKSLRYRLEAAFLYLEENPDTKVIVSGGQGSGEDLSEAEAMKGYLLERGISEERILTEDRSVNTAENIRFSKELLDADRKDVREPKVVLATSSFHVYRGLRIARKQGLEHVSGLPAKNDAILVFSYYIRECLAVIKDFLVGNL